MRLVEFKIMKQDVYTHLSPKPSLRLNPDGVEMEAVNPTLLLPYSIEVLRLNIMGRFYSYTGLTIFDQINTARRIFKLVCFKADKCLVSAETRRENIDLSPLSVILLISLIRKPAAEEGRIWTEGGLPALF
jgi:hypothetical protein